MTIHAFKKQLDIGHKYEAQLDKYFGQFYHITQASRRQQSQGIDRFFECDDGGKIAVEYKADLKANDTGNAFIETVSVDYAHKKGWAYTSQADVLAYYIPQSKRCFLICFDFLRAQLPIWERSYRTVPVQNQKYKTKGLLVPLLALTDCAFENCYLESNRTPQLFDPTLRIDHE